MVAVGTKIALRPPQPSTIIANGDGDHIQAGAISTGTSITSAQIIHAAGAGDVITFETLAADSTAATWTAASTVDGGNISTGIGANSTVNFGNNAGSGSEALIVTGDLTRSNAIRRYPTTVIAIITLGNDHDAAGDQIIFNNATNESAGQHQHGIRDRPRLIRPSVRHGRRGCNSRPDR
jgi:hypothetical protein